MKKLHDPELQIEFKSKVEKAVKDYKYQPELTKELNNHKGDFTENTILKIVLWKTNRYPVLPEGILAEVNSLRKAYSEEKAKLLLGKLLDKEKVTGFDLPMASTLLRFACPDHLQIIDQRVYRFITPGKNKLNLYISAAEKVDLYFEYIKRLHALCLDYDIPFSDSDKIFYQLDKFYNKENKIH